jgi:hypothetical protein
MKRWTLLSTSQGPKVTEQIRTCLEKEKAKKEEEEGKGKERKLEPQTFFTGIPKEV